MEKEKKKGLVKKLMEKFDKDLEKKSKCCCECEDK